RYWLLLLLRQAEDHHRVAQRIADLEVAAAGDRHELLAVHRERHGRRVAARAGVELPQQLAGLGIVGVEVAVAFTGEGEAAGRGQRAAHHRLRDLVLPRDLAGLEVDRGEQAVLLFAGDGHEGRAQPEPPLLPRRGVHEV